MEKRPLVSICIPTYNRGYILREILEKYVQDIEFNDDVEIVISDNCSTDDTETICKSYAKRYNNVKYYRNTKNVEDANFYIVLDKANGQYLKLLNDWAFCVGENLYFVKEKLRENMKERRTVFFTNHHIFTKKNAEKFDCKDLDEYVQIVSTYVTSNNIFGCWREQWLQVKDKSKYTALKLQQVDWTYQILLNSKGCLIYNKRLLSTSKTQRTILQGYNWFQVHIDNYYTIMMPYVNSGKIAQKTMLKDKHYLLKHFRVEMCYVYFYNFNKRWRFDTTGTTKILKKYYAGDSYLFSYFLSLPFYYLYFVLKYFFKYLIQWDSNKEYYKSIMDK